LTVASEPHEAAARREILAHARRKRFIVGASGLVKSGRERNYYPYLLRRPRLLTEFVSEQAETYHLTAIK